MAKKKKLIFIFLPGWVLPGLIFFVVTDFLQVGRTTPFEYTLYFHWSVYVLMLLVLYIVSVKNNKKVLFTFLLWSGLKIILSGLFFAFLIWYFSPVNLKILTLVFTAIYTTTLIFEVWFAKTLLEEK
jgi:hypothetical protein